MADSGIEGIDATIRALDRMGGGIRGEMRGALREVAEHAAMRARLIAAAKGFAPPGRSGRGTGRLIGSIGTDMRGSSAYVVDRANRDGFRYPAVYEYGHGRVRDFLTPAAEEAGPELKAAAEQVINRLAREAGF